MRDCNKAAGAGGEMSNEAADAVLTGRVMRVRSLSSHAVSLWTAQNVADPGENWSLHSLPPQLSELKEHRSPVFLMKPHAENQTERDFKSM